MSYRGRVLIISNLISSALWHKLAVLEPPADLLIYFLGSNALDITVNWTYFKTLVI